MGAALNNIKAPDQFDESVGVLPCPGTSLIRIKVNNQAIYWQRGLALPGGSGIRWLPEPEFLAPGSFEFPDRADAIRVRAAVPEAKLPEGKRPAQVSIATRTMAELAIE